MASTNHSEEDELMLACQRQEFMAAKTLDSDLDLAFNLQMQEASNASLSAASSSQNPLIIPAPTPVDGYEGEAEFDYLSLMLQDIDRIAVEGRDREQSEEKMRRLKQDLNRRIDDQKFANYIMNVPEAEWERYGDKYSSPYHGNGGGLDKECFKLYVNGMVSEERVRDVRVMVAASGVAICDFGDNMVLEVKKPLEGAETMSREMAVLKGLVHGVPNEL